MTTEEINRLQLENLCLKQENERLRTGGWKAEYEIYDWHYLNQIISNHDDAIHGDFTTKLRDSIVYCMHHNNLDKLRRELERIPVQERENVLNYKSDKSLLTPVEEALYQKLYMNNAVLCNKTLDILYKYGAKCLD